MPGREKFDDDKNGGKDFYHGPHQGQWSNYLGLGTYLKKSRGSTGWTEELDHYPEKVKM